MKRRRKLVAGLMALLLTGVLIFIFRFGHPSPCKDAYDQIHLFLRMPYAWYFHLHRFWKWGTVARLSWTSGKERTMASIALFIFKSLRPPTIRCYRRHSCAPCGKPTIVNMFPTES